jgi:hypothetical protein
LFVILARKAPYGVIFRRGPSRHVRLIGWRTDSDTFEYGQWLKGRIYERRCDLSPRGHFLIYFAADFRRSRELDSWTAISRPPWLTALALWPKGDCWHGGGLFETEQTIFLNHRPESADLVEGCNLPRRWRVKANARAQGEDWPIYAQRLIRDGWTLVQEGCEIEHGQIKQRQTGVWIRYDPPMIWERKHPSSRGTTLRMLCRGIKELNGPWYLLDYEVRERVGRPVLIERSQWADWDRNGDLLYAKDGALFRARPNTELKPDGHAPLGLDLDKSVVLADFSLDRFQAVEAPEAARTW